MQKKIVFFESCILVRVFYDAWEDLKNFAKFDCEPIFWQQFNSLFFSLSTEML